MKKKCFLGILLSACMAMSMGCSADDVKGRKEIKKEDQKITVIDDTKDVNYKDDAIKSIEIHKEIYGYGWLSKDKILVKIENKELYDKLPEDQRAHDTMGNLYSYDINTKEKIIINEDLKSQSQEYAKISPNKKCILYVDILDSKQIGYIIDLSGKVIKEVKGLNAFNFTEARWIDDKTIIAKNDENDTKLINLEKEDKLINIKKLDGEVDKTTKLIKVKSYYNLVDRKLMHYDIVSEESRLIEEDVSEVTFSPNKKYALINKHISETGNESIVLYDLDTEEKTTLAEGITIYGENWSDSSSKITYMKRSLKDDETGLYVMNLSDKSEKLISTEYYGYSAVFNIEENKLMLNVGATGPNGYYLDAVHIITLN